MKLRGAAWLWGEIFLLFWARIGKAVSRGAYLAPEGPKSGSFTNGRSGERVTTLSFPDKK